MTFKLLSKHLKIINLKELIFKAIIPHIYMEEVITRLNSQDRQEASPPQCRGAKANTVSPVIHWIPS